MKNLYQRLLLLIAGATQLELARHVRYLKIENEILRSKLTKRVPVTPQEQNRLVKFGAKLGKALGELVSIVHPDTLPRWIRDSQKSAIKKTVTKGRPRTQEQIRELILMLARENDWGYTRILGELWKGVIGNISSRSRRRPQLHVQALAAAFVQAACRFSRIVSFVRDSVVVQLAPRDYLIP